MNYVILNIVCVIFLTLVFTYFSFKMKLSKYVTMGMFVFSINVLISHYLYHMHDIHIEGVFGLLNTLALLSVLLGFNTVYRSRKC